MNDDVSLTDEQLQLATSRHLPKGDPLVGDLAAVHTTFLALGRALENAGGAIDEAALLAGIQRRLAAEPIDPLTIAPVVPIKTQRLTPVGWLATALTTAAAVLIAVSNFSGVDEPVEIAQETVKVVPQPIFKTETSVADYPLDEPEPSPAPFNWGEELDEEIALAAATLNQWSTNTRGVDASLTNMGNDLSTLSEELLSESL